MPLTKGLPFKFERKDASADPVVLTDESCSLVCPDLPAVVNVRVRPVDLRSHPRIFSVLHVDSAPSRSTYG